MDKIHPLNGHFCFSDQDVILDYMEDAERNISAEIIVERILDAVREQGKHTHTEILQEANRTVTMLTNRMVSDGAIKEIERQSFVQKTLKSVRERLKNTASSKLDPYSTNTQREIHLFYEEVLTGSRNYHRDVVRTGIEDLLVFSKTNKQ